MEMMPDFGKALLERGMAPEGDVHLNDFLVANCGTPDGSTFSCTCNVTLEGRPYALTIDMSRALLDHLIIACPPGIAKSIVDALASRPGNGWTLQFDEPARVSASGQLGAEQHAGNGEVFVPLIASTIKATDRFEPLSATLALVAIGREAAAFFEGEPGDDAERRRLRSRVKEIGQLLDAQGGIELMREVYEAAVRYLADEEIVLGRWIESVWDGIGSWLG
jgi:hypothetical protein